VFSLKKPGFHPGFFIEANLDCRSFLQGSGGDEKNERASLDFSNRHPYSFAILISGPFRADIINFQLKIINGRRKK
jgi:hypothetical protein